MQTNVGANQRIPVFLHGYLSTETGNILIIERFWFILWCAFFRCSRYAIHRFLPLHILALPKLSECWSSTIEELLVSVENGASKKTKCTERAGGSIVEIACAF